MVSVLSLATPVANRCYCAITNHSTAVLTDQNSITCVHHRTNEQLTHRYETHRRKHASCNHLSLRQVALSWNTTGLSFLSQKTCKHCVCTCVFLCSCYAGIAPQSQRWVRKRERHTIKKRDWARDRARYFRKTS